MPVEAAPPSDDSATQVRELEVRRGDTLMRQRYPATAESGSSPRASPRRAPAGGWRAQGRRSPATRCRSPAPAARCRRGPQDPGAPVSRAADRVAQRRSPRSPRVKLASGAGAVVSAQSGVRDGEFLVSIDVTASTRPGDPDSVVRIASRVEREWLTPNTIEIVHRFDGASGNVRAFEIERYDALLTELGATPAAVVDTHIHADYVSGGRAAAAQPSRDRQSGIGSTSGRAAPSRRPWPRRSLPSATSIDRSWLWCTTS